jgi:hypothetical protein
VSDTRAPDTGRKAVPPFDSADTELIEAFTPRRRGLSTSVLLVASALVGLVVLAGIVVSVLTVSDDSTRPLIPSAPLTPISVPAAGTATPALTTTPSALPPSDQTAPPVPLLPPVTATAETVTTAPAYPREPSNSPRVRDRLHELFPRLFPENP